MANVIIENAVEVVVTMIITLIGVLGTYLTAKIGKKMELANINTALDELFNAVEITVAELQQTVVDGMKEAANDGKLTEEEISELNHALIYGAKKKLSPAAEKLLTAAGMDICAIIKGMGEKAVLGNKK